MSLQPLPPFENREYTLESLVEQLGLMEQHVNDGSWKSCSCNPEKHLPLIAGYASEGYRFAKSPGERAFMENLRDRARMYKAKIKSRELQSQEDMDKIADWAREARHGVEERSWRLEGAGERGNPRSYVEALGKRLYVGKENIGGSESRMATIRDLAGVNGVVLASEGAGRLIDMYGGTYGQWIKLLGSGLIQLVPLFMDIGDPWDMYAVIAGSHLFIPEAINKIEAAIAPTVPLAAARAAAARAALPSYQVKVNRAVEVMPVGTAPSRYVITG